MDKSLFYALQNIINNCSCTWEATFLFSTGHIHYHVFRAGVGRARQRCNRHKISTADSRLRGSRLTRAIWVAWCEKDTSTANSPYDYLKTAVRQKLSAYNIFAIYPRSTYMLCPPYHSKYREIKDVWLDSLNDTMRSSNDYLKFW